MKLLVTTFGTHTFNLVPTPFAFLLEYLEENLGILLQSKNVSEVIIVDYGKEAESYRENIDLPAAFNSLSGSPFCIDEASLRDYNTIPEGKISSIISDKVESLIRQARVIKKDQLISDKDFIEYLKEEPLILDANLITSEDWKLQLFGLKIEIILFPELAYEINPIKYLSLAAAMGPKLKFVFNGNSLKAFEGRLLWETYVNSKGNEIGQQAKKYPDIFKELADDINLILQNSVSFKSQISQAFAFRYSSIRELMRKIMKSSKGIEGAFEDALHKIADRDLLDSPEYEEANSYGTKREIKKRVSALHDKYYKRAKEHWSFERYLSIVNQKNELQNKIIKSIFPEFLFKILDDDHVRFFNELRSAPQEYFIIKCNDADFVQYLLKDALKDQKEYIAHYSALLPWSEPNRNYRYLIVKDFDLLTLKQKQELLKRIDNSRDHYSSIVFLVQNEEFIVPADIFSKLKTANVPTYEEILELRYKIFFYILNKSFPIDIQSYEQHFLHPFYLGMFTEELKSAKSVSSLEEILNSYKEFDYSDLLHPLFWYNFERRAEEIEKRVKETPAMAPVLKKEYYVKYEGDTWEISYGYQSPIRVKHILGLHFLFYTLYNRKTSKLKAFDIYNRFADDPADSNSKAAENIKRRKNDAIANIKKIEETMRVGSGFSKALTDNFKIDPQFEDIYCFMTDEFENAIEVIVPEGYYDIAKG